MKKIIFLSVVLALVAMPALAEVCPTGQHWESNETVVPAHYVNGACNAWTTPVCLVSEVQCTVWGPFHLICWEWDNVCTSYSTPVCTGYEQILVPEVITPGGWCVDDEVIPEPIEEVVETPKAGGLNMYALAPIVSQSNYTYKRTNSLITVNWLCQQAGQGRLLVNGEPVNFALDGYGKFLGYSLYSSFANYGYSDSIPASGSTFFTAVFNNSGSVYVRPVCISKNGEALGLPMTIK